MEKETPNEGSAQKAKIAGITIGISKNPTEFEANRDIQPTSIKKKLLKKIKLYQVRLLIGSFVLWIVLIFHLFSQASERSRENLQNLS